MTAKQRLGIGATAKGDGFDVGDGLAATGDRVALAIVLDGIEEVGELAGGFGCCHFRHANQIIRYMAGSVRPPKVLDTFWTDDRFGRMPDQSVKETCLRSEVGGVERVDEVDEV